MFIKEVTRIKWKKVTIRWEAEADKRIECNCFISDNGIGGFPALVKKKIRELNVEGLWLVGKNMDEKIVIF